MEVLYSKNRRTYISLTGRTETFELDMQAEIRKDRDELKTEEENKKGK